MSKISDSIQDFGKLIDERNYLREQVAELTEKLAAAESKLKSISDVFNANKNFLQELATVKDILAATDLSVLSTMLAKERQAGRDSYQKEMSTQRPEAWLHTIPMSGDEVYLYRYKSRGINQKALIIRPEAPKDKE